MRVPNLHLKTYEHNNLIDTFFSSTTGAAGFGAVGSSVGNPNFLLLSAYKKTDLV